MVEIREVKSKKEIKQFLNLPLELYKGNKFIAPALYGDEKKMFKPNYMYYDQAESKFWIAYRDGKVVGRVQAILQKVANVKWNQKRVRFTRFDSIDDQEAANALLNKVEEYAKEKGMNELVGPLGFSDLDREGLLIEGFDQLNTFEEQYNFDYYQKLLENYGFSKEIDWLEYRILPNKEKYEKVIMLGNKLLKRSGLHFIEGLSYKKFAKRYKDQFFGMLDQTYDKLYGTVPFSDGMKDLLINNFTPLINMDYLIALADDNDKIVAFCIAFPSITEVLQKSGGHLYPITALKILRTVKHPKRIDLGLIGVSEEDSLTGAIAIIIGRICELMLKYKLEYMETNLNLENNTEILGLWKHFDVLHHKRRRSFIKKVNLS